jgi:hypothetical protein
MQRLSRAASQVSSATVRQSPSSMADNDAMRTLKSCCRSFRISIPSIFGFISQSSFSPPLTASRWRSHGRVPQSDQPENPLAAELDLRFGLINGSRTGSPNGAQCNSNCGGSISKICGVRNACQPYVGPSSGGDRSSLGSPTRFLVTPPELFFQPKLHG